MAVSSLEGKVVIVTGAGSGLGQTMVLGLAAAGADVLALDIVKSRAAETAKLLSGLTGAGASAAAE